MDEPLSAIIDLLRKEHGISPAKLLPSMRIYHDLGADGDDAHDLLQHIHERFGTDFSELSWQEYFNSEGISLRSCIILVVSIVVAGALTGWVAIASRLPKWMFWEVDIAVLVIMLFGVKRLLPEKPKRPVTIAGLAEVIQNGAWPKDPAKVR